MEPYMWIITLCVFLAVNEACRCRREDRDFDDLWRKFKEIHNKRYCRREECKRRCIWNKCVRRMIKHNLEHDHGQHKFKRGLNKYSDLTHEEFVSTLNGFWGSPEYRRGRHNHTMKYPSGLLSAEEIPESLDWRDEGLVTSVKDQGLCGSCYAFSAVASLEGQILKKTIGKDHLSEQNLVDCSSSHGNKGCQGGLMTQSFSYVIDNKGIEKASTYPYRAKEGQCKFQKSNVAASIRDYKEIEYGNVDALLEALVTVGPISVGIDASLKSFQDYKSGIYDDMACSSKNLDHAVLLVGYGTEDGVDYWIIKNSFGTTWGEKGYLKIERKNNLCGIATQASYPIV